MTNSLISIIITTRNEEKNLSICLNSILEQKYKYIEIIVVDNNSTDKTKEIVKDFQETRNKKQETKTYLYNKGPERSVQRNYGVKKAKGKYVLILDADMKLAPSVVSDCVSVMQKGNSGGVIIPEESYGVGFWAQVKKLERSFYVGNDQIEAARFFDRKKFLEVGGFDEAITGPEDWDLSQRIKDAYGLVRIKSFIFHNEGELSFMRSIRKKYYYAQNFNFYVKKSANNKYIKSQMSLLQRYHVFISQPKKLLKNPVLGVGVFVLKTAEFIAGGIGYFGGAKR